MSSKTTTVITDQLADQLDFHWTHQLRPRLGGLTDDEYFWAPVPNCWTVHPDGAIDFDFPEPEPAPFTTIAWRLAHVIVGVLAMRDHSHFDGPPADYQSWPYATDAATASTSSTMPTRNGWRACVRSPMMSCTGRADPLRGRH